MLLCFVLDYRLKTLLSIQYSFRIEISNLFSKYLTVQLSFLENAAFLFIETSVFLVYYLRRTKCILDVYQVAYKKSTQTFFF